MQHGGDAEDVIPADVRHWRLDDASTVLQAAITLEGFPGAIPVSPLGAGENLQILTVRHQHNLWIGGHMTQYRRTPTRTRYFWSLLQTLLEVNEVRGQRAPSELAVRPFMHTFLLRQFSYRIDERVRRLDVTEGGVQRQAEADRVVQAGLKADWSGKNHVPEGTTNVTNVQKHPAFMVVGERYLEPG